MTRSIPRPQSATSLPRAPRDSAHARSTRYLVMMGVRVLCFVLMVVITPYGWYTWVFGLAAVFLPYFAVVLANVGEEGKNRPAESPERVLTAGPSAPEAPAAGDERVIRIAEASPDESEQEPRA
ncbi:hypothetical protein GCM10022200_03010 [Microbacterium awajiense]|uniref:DUF3099 domain-containing protein n=1 Tax=Microbacterium awajiense TaxID=415214 RepID=A0ABP7A3A3_9MICO